MTKRVHALGWHLDDMSDFEFRLVILGPPISLKRHWKPRVFRGRASMSYDAKASNWLKDASAQLIHQWRPVFPEPIRSHHLLNAAILSYLPTLRETDASNLYEGPQDAMKGCSVNCKPKCARHAAIMVDDFQVRTHNGSDRLYDKMNPRVEIALTPYDAKHVVVCMMQQKLSLD